VVNFTQSIPTAVSAGNDYSSTFDDSVAAGGVTATTDSDYTVAVDPDAANEWRMVQQPSGSATASVAFGTQPTVELTDQYGNRITTDSTTQVTAAAVLASDGITPGTGTLSGTNPVTISSGLGTFTDLSYDTGEDIQLKFTGGGYTEVNSSTISVTAPAQATSATADISPNTVAAGTASQAYTYTITPSGGSADTFVITNPFGSNDDITVTSATINANPATLTNLGSRPGAGDNLDWDYVAGTDLLTLLLPLSYLENGWPLVVNFTQSIPTAVSAGNDYSSTFDDSVLAGGVTATTDSDYTVAVDPDAANEWRMVQQPSGTATTGIQFGIQPQVELTDQFGNRITTDSTTQVTAAAVLASDGITPGTGTLSGVNPVTISSGLGTFTDLSYDTEEDIDLKFTGGGYTEINSSAISVTAAAAQAGSATADISPNTVTAGTASQAYTYTITPSGGSADTFVITNPFGSNDDITVTSATINANPATLTNAVGRPGAGDNLDWDYVAGTDQLTLLLPSSYLENGWPLVVNFTQSIPTAVSTGNDYSSTFDDSVLAGGVTATTDSDYTVAVDPDAANEWRMVQQPSATGDTGAPFGTQPTVELTDQYGNRITTDSTTQVTAAAVLASDGITPGTGTLSGVNPVTISSGLGTFTDLSYDTIEDIQLKFTGGGHTEVNSSTISMAGQAASATADISPNTVTAGTASQAYTYTITPSGGSADTFVITNPFGSNDDITVTSATINANPATLTNAVGRPGAGDNLDWDYVAGTDQLTLLLPLSYLENGWPLVVNFTQSIPTAVSAGNDYSSTFDDSVLAGGAAATTDSDYTVAVDPDAANEWRMVQQPSASATASVAFTTQPQVELTDQYGNRITTDSTTQVTAAAVLASDGITPGSGTLSGVNPVTISSGLGTFTDLSYDTGEDIQLKFTGGGYTEVNSSTISVGAQASSATADISPNTVAAGTASQAYTYTITPSGGSADTFVITNPFGSNDDISVTSATINANPATLTNAVGRPGAGDNLDWDYVAGTDQLTLLLPLSYLENGWPLVVNFTQSIPTAVSTGNDYSSTFDDSVLAGGVTATTDSDYTVAVDPDAANEWRMVQQPSGTATTGVAFATQPTVELTDQYGNRITTDSTTQVTAAAVLASDGITPGSGTLSGVNPVTISSGLGTFTDLSYDFEEDIQLKFTGGGHTEVNSSTISVTASADNDPPGIPTSFTGTDAGTDVTQVDFTWANPGDGDLAGVMILRNTSSITDEPVQKTNYSVGNVIGTSVVVVRSGVTTSALEDETTIPSDPLTAGVRYYYKAFSFDNVNNYQITGEPEVNTIPYERTLEQGYNMIGLPGEIAGYTADNTFPDDLSYRRVLKWTGSYAIHANTDSFVEGEGYWLLNNTGGSVVVDIDPNSYVAQVTAPVIVSFTTTGWQLIANPCLTNVSGADIEVQLSAPDIPNCGDEFCTFAEAVTGGYVKNSIYRWKGGTYSNSELRNIAAGDNMEPWKSYWLYVFGGSTFVQDIRTTCGSQ
jgi:hypothetical protein